MLEQHIKVGKDVLESLTTSMYEDHKSIFREYIQNACDQIDRAVKLGILSKISDGEIYININSKNRIIEIEDNATGIKANEVYSILGNIALSNKDRENERGFRGIGRLAGLGYCDELIFETSFKDEDLKTIMSWNAKKFKQRLNDRNHKEEATTVIESIINTTTEKCTSENHFFKITLKNVSNDELLDTEIIREYLSMVAPLPIKSHFIYKNKILEEANKNGIQIDEYNIFVNSEQLYKPYSADIKDRNNKKIDDIIDIEFINIKNNDKTLLCWGWYGISKFEGTLTKNNIFRAIRLRKGNIQIGYEGTLNKLHKEDRGNNYFIGEIHAIDSSLIPNARRDYFSENESCKIFEDKIKEIFYSKLHKLYYKASDTRSAVKKIEDYNLLQEEFKVKQKMGFKNKEEIKKFQEELERKAIEAEKAKSKLDKLKNEDDTNILKIIEKTTSNVSIVEYIEEKDTKTTKPIFITQKEYPQFDRKTQKLISKIYDVIDNVLPKEIALNLKLKIREKLN
jgi:molecular chaperone HtpG